MGDVRCRPSACPVLGHPARRTRPGRLGAGGGGPRAHGVRSPQSGLPVPVSPPRWGRWARLGTGPPAVTARPALGGASPAGWDVLPARPNCVVPGQRSGAQDTAELVLAVLRGQGRRAGGPGHPRGVASGRVSSGRGVSDGASAQRSSCGGLGAEERAALRLSSPPAQVSWGPCPGGPAQLGMSEQREGCWGPSVQV